MTGNNQFNGNYYSGLGLHTYGTVLLIVSSPTITAKREAFMATDSSWMTTLAAESMELCPEMSP